MRFDSYRAPDWIDVEKLDCCVYSCRCYPNRRSERIRSMPSMAADMTWLRVHANSAANRDEPVNWPPWVCLAFHHIPIFGHPTVGGEINNHSVEFIRMTIVRDLGYLPSLVASAISFVLFFSCLCTVYFETKRVSLAARGQSFLLIVLSLKRPVVDLHCNRFWNETNDQAKTIRFFLCVFLWSWKLSKMRGIAFEWLQFDWFYLFDFYSIHTYTRLAWHVLYYRFLSVCLGIFFPAHRDRMKGRMCEVQILLI